MRAKVANQKRAILAKTGCPHCHRRRRLNLTYELWMDDKKLPLQGHFKTNLCIYWAADNTANPFTPNGSRQAVKDVCACVCMPVSTELATHSMSFGGSILHCKIFSNWEYGSRRSFVLFRNRQFSCASSANRMSWGKAQCSFNFASHTVVDEFWQVVNCKTAPMASLMRRINKAGGLCVQRFELGFR